MSDDRGDYGCQAICNVHTHMEETLTHTHTHTHTCTHTTHTHARTPHTHTCTQTHTQTHAHTHTTHTAVPFLCLIHRKPGQVQRMGPGSMGPKILYRNVHTAPRQGKELFPIVLVPLPTPVSALFPCRIYISHNCPFPWLTDFKKSTNIGIIKICFTGRRTISHKNEKDGNLVLDIVFPMFVDFLKSQEAILKSDKTLEQHDTTDRESR